ncbi:TetR/AcrR family transcriptional regulator [Cellulomonas denverensis]|uniref:TetR/AcrR family transcriptional regulator n=1 Tax=Cellulomonas denverensis TaxID=264297 RepID=UPI0019424707|nr:TetR/AcrR family transcriptional regulator [Cellulomonas denverensis]GIG23885.1 TetR family transcriptional regulator [Cellulomonas denverensis]
MSTEALPGYAKGRAKKAEILAQAVAIFGESGYRGASLRDIAARCGISHPGLLHHFPTKEALLLAVLEQRDEADQARMSGAGSRGVDTLRRTVDLVRVNSERRGIVELFAVVSAEATAPDHPAHEYFVARYDRSVDVTAAAYREAQEDGQLLAGVDPINAGRQLIAVMDGLQVQWLLSDGAIDMVEPVRALVQANLTVPL